MHETWVQSLGWEDLLEKGITTCILAWRIPWTEEPVGYSPCDRKESDTTEQLTTYYKQYKITLGNYLKEINYKQSPEK